MEHRCVACGRQHPTEFHPFCSACGGMVDVEYALDQVHLADSRDPFVRFAGLLPLVEPLLPREGSTRPTYTPLVHAQRLGRQLGLSSLFLKDETVLPTRSTKDRMAAVSMAYLRERGVRTLCASSTGNSGTSFAYAIDGLPGMHLFLFTAEEFVPRVQHADHGQVTHFGMRDASFVEAAAYANVYATQHGLTAESGFFNPARREGLKLAFLEASEQAPRTIDWYVQAVSSAMGVYGSYKGAREMHAMGRIPRLPRMLCVQQESCAPMVRAFADGSETIRAQDIVPRPSGIAQAILRGDPTRAYPHVRRVVIQSGGGFTAVSEREIREARQRVEDAEGISPCFSASAAVAGVIKNAGLGVFANDPMIVINLTGGDRASARQDPRVHWIQREVGGWDAPSPDEVLAKPAAINSPG